MTPFYHTSVLVAEVLEGLRIVSGKRYIDATVGGGGHANEIAKRGGIVLGIDTDSDALEHVRQNFGKAVTVREGNFRDIEKIARENGFGTVAGVLFDLGVSSHQLDTAERGFSYRFSDAPLDMRLNQKDGSTAEELIARASEDELYEIFAENAQEERARTIAVSIVRARKIKPIVTVGDLMACITRAVAGKREIPEVASRIFQAIRMTVNDERTALKEGLEGAKQVMEPGGRLAVISFHSLEDRAVKRFMNGNGWMMITKKPITAGPEERRVNRRSRSAKLRIAQKI